jgi:hypothetical protein
LVAKVFKSLEIGLYQWIVRVNNRLVRQLHLRLGSAELLILIPHCLQNSECDVKILRDVRDCNRCGRCEIKRLLDMTEKFGLTISAVGGGGEAKEVLAKGRYKGVVAVACEKELASGICEIFPAPVYGVLNLRPKGPCKDTRVDVSQVEAAVQSLMKG